MIWNSIDQEWLEEHYFGTFQGKFLFVVDNGRVKEAYAAWRSRRITSCSSKSIPPKSIDAQAKWFFFTQEAEMTGEHWFQGEAYRTVVISRSQLQYFVDRGAKPKEEKMSEETKVKPSVVKTTTLFANAFKKGGVMVAADQANEILCDGAVKKLLTKMGMKEEFLNTPFGELVMKWFVPAIINEVCVRTDVIPQKEYVSLACQAALDANTVHTLTPLMKEILPALTALKAVGKELAEEAAEAAKKSMDKGGDDELVNGADADPTIHQQ